MPEDEKDCLIELRDNTEKIAELEKISTLAEITRGNLIRKIGKCERCDPLHEIEMLSHRIMIAYKNRKWIKKEISELQEVLRDHLKSHKRVSEDQLNPAINREELFNWFDKEIKKQLEKLDGKDGDGEYKNFGAGWKWV